MKCSDFCYQNWCLQNVQSYLSNNPRIPNHQQHFNLPCPLTSPYPTQKKTLKTTRPIPPNWKKNRSNINLAVKVFTHPHSSFLNSYISHTWSETAWIDSTPMVGNQPTFQSWTLRFLRSQKVSPGTLASKAFTSFSFFRNSWIFNSTSLRDWEKISEDVQADTNSWMVGMVQDGAFFLFKRWWNDGKTAKMQVISKV